MSILENLSDLAHELRCAAGTVLSIVGSRLEATERARVDEVGPQWLNEFEAENDGMECTCGPCPLRDEDVCDEAEADESDQFEAVMARYGLSDSSAADTAADPSPATTTGCSRAGAEGPEGASAIPSAAPSGHLADAWYCHDCGVLNLVQALTDPGEVSAPSPGELVREDDLAAHITAIRSAWHDRHVRGETNVLNLSDEIARDLVSDYRITRK